MVYRADIDGLRALAVLAVVFCHAELGFLGGFVGVDVFFVISGYLITSLIQQDVQRGKFSLIGFWERRVRRILPALISVTLFTMVVGWFVLLPDSYSSLGRSVVALMTMLSNVYFWRSINYFHVDAAEKPLLHTWSLAVEEQFYLLYPLCVLVLLRLNRLRWMRSLMVFTAALSFALSVYATASYTAAAFYLLPTRTWELLAGAILAQWPSVGHGVRHPWREVVAFLGLLLILAPMVLYDSTTPFPGMAALPPVLGSLLLIWSGSEAAVEPVTSRLLAHPWMVFVGMISYSLYLWHWPLFAYSRYLSIEPLSLLERFGLVTASFAAGVLSWRYVETPFRERRFLAMRPALFATGFGAMAVTLLCGAALWTSDGLQNRLPPQAARYLETGRGSKSHAYFRYLADVPNNLVRFGRSDVPSRILVWGDSHASAILPAMESLSDETGVGVCAASHPHGAPVLGYYIGSRPDPGPRVVEFNDAVISYVRREQIPVVVLVANWDQYLAEAGCEPALFRTVAALQECGTTVYFMRDVPVFVFDAPRFIVLDSWHGRNLARNHMSLQEYERRTVREARVVGQLRKVGVRILDPVPAFCRQGGSAVIQPYDADGSFYVDRDHLSRHGALSIRSLFEELFDSTSRDVVASE